ncbi:hypothetical protein EI555_012546 [Monodon monoceros]|uniref:Uncharacterized protein n=1 Tax=Monodon monoceros TaxID=40151 RepID=A0A4U1F990_MONMO|nr:hypothetical protein EI555_012546 [Monodon monoceros]
MGDAGAAPIPEITGPLGHRQPPAEKELPALNHCHWKPQEETRGGDEEERQQAATRKTPGCRMARTPQPSMKAAPGKEPLDQPCPLP